MMGTMKRNCNHDKHTIKVTFILCCIGFILVVSAHTASAEYKIVWSDEFKGSELDPSKWSHDVWPGANSGNQELQYYTDNPANSYIKDDCLIIEARKEDHKEYNYTSARLHSKTKGDFLYGRIEARIKIPNGQGMWPAFWMLPTDNAYGTWAASGEIDIMEAINADPAEITGSLHFGGEWPRHKYLNGHYTATSNEQPVDFSEDFHVYAIEWTPYEFRWYVDGNLYASQDDWVCDKGPYPAPFNKPFHLVLNLAVGGHWPGPPDDSTPWPMRMYVDWVRVSQTDNKAPQVHILSPKDNSLLPSGESIEITAEVTDADNNVELVQFYAADKLIAVDKNPPYSCTVNPKDGYHLLRVRAVDKEGFARSNRVHVACGKSEAQEPFHGTPHVIPGKVEAEDFDSGFPDEAFADFDTINPENKYRLNQPVEILACSEGGYKVGWMDTGEWLEYTINVKISDSYLIAVRVSSDNGKGKLHIKLDGEDVTGSLAVPNTGGWDTFKTIQKNAVKLQSGVHTLQLYVDAEGVNMNYIELQLATTESSNKAN